MPSEQTDAIFINQTDKDILRRLASDLAEIAALPVHKRKARLWQKLNDLESERPMVWINEICWNEMNVNDELTLQCEHPWARYQEDELKRTLYQWRHLPGDMVINEYLCSPLALSSTEFGISEDVDVVRTDDTSDVVSRHFKVQIRDFKDLEKIKMPVITHDETATEKHYRTMCDVYNGIMPVRKMEHNHIWFTPWDYLIRCWGIQEAMTDMIDRPELVHAGVERMVDAWMTQLDQLEKLNALALNNNNTRIGSGGYGYTKELPGNEYDPGHVNPINMWGCSNAQIFSEVSPRMHWEFAIEHDLRWLARWGMVYYGCCEPLDKKVEILKRIPNLRKVSASPWCNTERIIAGLGGNYVISHKPNPAIFAGDNWNPQAARQAIRDFLDRTGGGCHVELIMKDIPTLCYEPHRLWEWEKIAMEEATRF